MYLQPIVGAAADEDVPGFAPRDAVFSPLDELAIRLGRQDPAPRPGGWRWARRVADADLGGKRAQPLADPRLEAIRRLVVATRGHPADLAPHIAAAKRAGVARVAIELLLGIQGVRWREFGELGR